MLTTLALLAMSQVPKGYRLVWSDEFNKDGRPDAAKWVYEEGYVRNNEAQFYTKDRPENARIEKGRLVIEARKDNWNEKPITSASLTTEGKQAWTYGRFEVRAKVPTGKGTWPAIWTLGTNIREVGWPKCGEIDILEHVGFEPDRLHFNIHTQARNHLRQNGRGGSITHPKPHEDFHVYGCEWTPTRIVWFFDGKEVLAYDKEVDSEDEWPFTKPQYLILNLAIGGAWGGQQGIAENLLPCRFEIDWVRIYQKKG